MTTTRLLTGHVLECLRRIDDESVNCIVTSPPYWALRDYGIGAVDWPALSYRPIAECPQLEVPAQRVQLGLEPTLADFIGHLVLVFREARRVLRKDGVLWVNMGDNYIGSHRGGTTDASTLKHGSKDHQRQCKDAGVAMRASFRRDRHVTPRSDVAQATGERMGRGPGWRVKNNESFHSAMREMPKTRNMRSVWTMSTEPYSGDHFATFPSEIPRRTILATCPAGGTVLDLFNGSGTSAEVAHDLGMDYIGIDADPTHEIKTLERLAHRTSGLMLEHESDEQMAEVRG